MLLALASSNRKKYKEIKEILAPMNIELSTALALGFTKKIIETGTTFEENALLKAKTVALTLKIPTLADDSGLQVEALAGAPGVLSARYAGINSTDIQRNSKLLQAMQGIPIERRTAVFICVIACCRPDGATLISKGQMYGRIAFLPSGKNGFGYDSIFEIPERGITIASLTTREKNIISHRGQALRSLSAKINLFLEKKYGA